MTTEVGPLSSFTLTGNIRIKKNSSYYYSITITKNGDEFADAILEKFRRLEEHLVHPQMIIYTLMSIPSQEQNSPVAVLYSNPFLIKKNRTDQIVIKAYTKLANQKIYHRIPSGSFKNVYFEFSNTPSFNSCPQPNK